MNIIEKAFELLTIFNVRGFQAYMVGGASRDVLRGLPYGEIHDVDICTDAVPEEIIEISNERGFNWFQEGQNAANYGTVTVMFDAGTPIQITPYRSDAGYDGRHCTCSFGKTLKKDLERRDFAMNAIAIDRHWNIVDLFGGVDDIKNKIVRSIEEPSVTYERDELRAMRAIRLAITMGFKIEQGTFDGLCAVRIATLSNERIRDELTKILESPNRLRGILHLWITGLLAQILPEVEKLHGVEQDILHHPEKDVFLHTLLCVGFLPEKTSVERVMATVLHDVAKPPCRTVEGDSIHFYQHEDVGAEMANVIMHRLKFTAEQNKKVTWLVKNHMRIYNFSEMKKSKKIGLVTHSYFKDLLELMRVDTLGSMANPAELVEEINEFIRGYEEEVKRRPALTQKLINGDDILHTMYGFVPKKIPSAEGIKVGEILEKVNDEVAEGRINSRDEALEYMKELIGDKNE